MAKTRKRDKAHASKGGDMHEFAKMSRGVIDAARKPAAKGRRKTSSRSGRAAATDLLGERARAKATTVAVELGRKQADWIVDKRKARLAKRAKVVKSVTKTRKLAERAVAKRGGEATTTGVVVAEGDSWFDYPFYDILKILEDDYGYDVEKGSHRGDTVESMAYDGGQLEDFVRTIERVIRRGQRPRAILLSGGGNDVAGDGFAMLLNHRSSPTNGLNEAILTGVIETRIAVAYTTVLSAVTQTCKRLLGGAVPIILHGYDYPVPDGRGFLGGWGPLPGPWLEPGFREKGYEDLEERIAIAKVLIDRFNEALTSVANMPGFAHVQVLNLRESLSTDLSGDRYKDSWGNELHPTEDGFEVVAQIFADLLVRT